MAINLPIVSKFDAKGIKEAEGALGKLGKAAKAAAAVATAAVAGIATASVKEFAKFDAALVKSQSIMGDLSDTMKTDMAAAAREVAKTTTFSAEQAAESFYFLASAGLDAEASIAAMPSVAKFAQAGMFDMALATDLLTDAQSALGLVIRDDAVANMENMVRVSDTLARASQLANATIEQFSTSLTTKAGTALKTVGKDVEEGAAALAVFADQGVKGELAGTQLTNTIFGLSDRAKAVPDKFKELGISVFDASGNMRNFADIADDFNNSLGQMSTQQKLATLSNLGFTKQARSGLLLIMENGEAMRNYEAEIRKAGGTTDEVANNQLQSLSSQLELAKSRVQDLGIGIGAALAPSMFALLDAIAPIIEESGPIFADLIAKLTPLIAQLAAMLPRLISALMPLLPVFVGIVEILVQAIDFVLPIFIQLLEGILPVVAGLLPVLMQLLNSIFIPLMPAIQAVVAALMPLIEALLPLFIQLVNTLLPVALNLLEAVIVPLTPAIIAVAEALTPLLVELLPLLTEILSTFVIPILNVVIELFQIGLVTALGVFQMGLENFTGFLQGFASTFRNIWNSISGFLKGIINGMIGFFEGFANTAIDAVNAIVRAVNSIKIDIPAFPPFFMGATIRPVRLATIPKVSIPRLAEGGIVMPQKGGVFANLAEAGKPEAVIPLDRMGSFGNTYNVTVNAGMGADGGRIGQVIVDEIKKFERHNGKVFASA